MAGSRARFGRGSMVALAAGLLAASACEQGTPEAPAPTAEARAERAAGAKLRDADGKEVGRAAFLDTPHGLVIVLKLDGLPPGTHAVHLHAVGECVPPFDSAGPHFNPTSRQHGYANPAGAHAGDLPNLHLPASGALEVEMLAADTHLDGAGGLLDEDGAALVVHAGPDDYRTDPAGDSGARIACGVIEGSGGTTPKGS